MRDGAGKIPESGRNIVEVSVISGESKDDRLGSGDWNVSVVGDPSGLGTAE
jgi:hypothetical protein